MPRSRTEPLPRHAPLAPIGSTRFAFSVLPAQRSPLRGELAQSVGTFLTGEGRKFRARGANNALRRSREEPKGPLRLLHWQWITGNGSNRWAAHSRRGMRQSDHPRLPREKPGDHRHTAMGTPGEKLDPPQPVPFAAPAEAALITLRALLWFPVCDATPHQREVWCSA